MEFVNSKDDSNQTLKIMNRCRDFLLKKHDEPDRQLSKNLFCEEYIQERFNKTMDILKDLETNKSK